MFSVSLVILKGIRRNNLYYLKGSAVTENLTASEYLEGDSTKLWQTRLEYVGLDSLQALAKKGLLKGALTCNLKFGEYYFLDKNRKVKFDTIIHPVEVLFDCVHVDVWGPTKTASISTLYFLLIIYLGGVEYTL